MPASNPVPRVALETTLLLHGVPRAESLPLARELAEIIRARGARPALVGVVSGEPIVGLSEAQLRTLLAADRVAKVNAANLGIIIHRREHGATTVSATLELAAAAGVRVLATGAIGGVHRGYGERLDISADLAAIARYPLAVVSSGVKSLLDVESTREALETLGVPVVGFRTAVFPAFYQRTSAASVDASFDDPTDIARFARAEIARTGRAVLVGNPVPVGHEIAPADWDRWRREAEQRARAAGTTGRDLTPHVLAALHEVSGGATLRANLALVRSNADLAARLAAAWRE